MRPDLTSLALFIRIAETRSITKAAEACHIALAAASRRVAQLEHQFGAALLYRTARGVELTPAGNAVLFHAREMMAQVEERVRPLHAVADRLYGRWIENLRF